MHVCFFVQLDSEITPITGVFQNYTGSSQDPNSRAVDVTQEEVCVQLLFMSYLQPPHTPSRFGQNVNKQYSIVSLQHTNYSKL